MANKAIFLDRDGVINKDTGYVSHSDDFIFIEGVIDACRMMKEKGYLLVLITNQSGIARGYFCPHHPVHGIGEYKQQCQCRKPQPGMILTAVEELDIDLSQSYLVGDKISDLQAGKAAGIATNVLVRTGKEITEQGEALADHVLDTLTDVIALLP